MSTAAQRKAFADGAQARRGGLGIDRVTQFYWEHEKEATEAWIAGWRAQSECAAMGVRKTITADDFQLSFELRMAELRRAKGINQGKELNMGTRTAEQLTQLRNEFKGTYTGDEAGFDAAFEQHLTTLDAAAPAAAPAKKGTAKKGGKATAAKKGGKATTAPKAKSAPKAKAFRPSSDDRKAFNVAAAKVAGKDVKTPRLVPAGGKATYTDFLQGKVLKLDADGSGSTKLNVVSAKDAKTVLGTVTVDVSKGKVKTTGAKA